MIAEPKCSKRKCKHFIGVAQRDDTEMTEHLICTAFPDGIPREIAFGDDPHTSVHASQADNDIVYER